MKNSGIILMYNCSGPEYSKLRQIFAMLRLRMHPITPDRYHLPLVDLAMGRGESAEEAPEAFQEKMLVFCGMNRVFLNQVLAVIRTANLPPIELKAVLTSTNRDWDSLTLHTELLKERETIANTLKEVRESKEEQESQAEQKSEDEQKSEADQEPQTEQGSEDKQETQE